MPITNNLSTVGLAFYQHLQAIREKETSAKKPTRYFSAPGVGSRVTAAYEQLRNASEYAEEHLLVQKAIRRFYSRNLSFHRRTVVDTQMAEELIVELTQAGYIENNTQPIEAIEKIEKITQKNYDVFWKLTKARTKRATARAWILDILSVEIEKLIFGDDQSVAFTQFAYQHYVSEIKRDYFLPADNHQDGYEASLYLAVGKVLLRSDIANVRFDMNRLYRVQTKDIAPFKHFQHSIDKMYYAETTSHIARYINKYGAPMRVLKNLLERNQDLAIILPDRKQFMAAYEAQIYTDYKDASRRLNEGVIKSIIFIIITKILIGIAIEVPYDLWVIGAVALLPLSINLLAPLIYMIILRLGLKLPGANNAVVMQDFMQNALYENTDTVRLYPKPKKRVYPKGFSVVYGLMFIIVFGIVVDRLVAWDFNLVQGAIFIVFMATVSFLGFRLSRIIRELEIVAARPGLLTVVRDFLYMPFIRLGQWLSSKYEKINIVALVLDKVIELPLKTVLRLIRQWIGFMSEKQDQI